MPVLKWDEVGVLECLEVIPEVDEYETEYRYRRESKSEALEFTLWPLESIVGLSIENSEALNPTMNFAVYVGGSIEYRNEGDGEVLLLHKCELAPSRFSYIDNPELSRFEGKLKLELRVSPNISIKMDYDA